MALVYCPDCGHQVSSLAAACVSCGYPMVVYRPAIDPLAAQKTLAHVGYGLLVAMNGVTWIGAVVMAYVKRKEVRGTWLESHFDWQIATFWWPMVWMVPLLLAFMLFGAAAGESGAAVPAMMLLMMAGMFGLMGWIIYRIIKGWVRLAEGRAID